MSDTIKFKDADFLESSQSLCSFACTDFNQTEPLDAELKRVFGHKQLFEVSKIREIVAIFPKNEVKRHQHVFFLLHRNSVGDRVFLLDILTLLHNLKLLATAIGLRKLVFCRSDPLFQLFNFDLFYDLLHLIFRDSNIVIQFYSYYFHMDL